MNYEAIILLILTIVSSALAIWQRKIAEKNKLEKEEAKEQVKEQQNTNTSTIDFFDPKNSNWVIPEGLPASTYTMADITKKYILDGLSNEDRELVQNKIECFEKNKIISYIIEYSKGYFVIQYGLIKLHIPKSN